MGGCQSTCFCISVTYQWTLSKFWGVPVKKHPVPSGFLPDPLLKRVPAGKEILTLDNFSWRDLPWNLTLLASRGGTWKIPPWVYLVSHDLCSLHEWVHCLTKRPWQPLGRKRNYAVSLLLHLVKTCSKSALTLGVRSREFLKYHHWHYLKDHQLLRTE